MDVPLRAQFDSSADFHTWGPAVQPEEQVGEAEVEMEVETCLPRLSHDTHLLQGRLTLFSLPGFFIQTGVTLVKPKFKDGWDEHQDHSLRGHL